MDRDADTWLLDPIGVPKEGMEQFIVRIANERGLRIERHLPDAGLVESLQDWPVSVSPKIENFYKQTSGYELDVRSVWKPVFGSLGYAVAKLFSRRIQQLNLPRDTDVESLVLKSEIIKLINGNGRADYTIWHRYVRDTGEVIFWGIYTTCKTPTGEFCVKAIFPLPRGSATVLFHPVSDVKGNLLLLSSGKNYGDPGFYFIVEDARGDRWKHYLPGFRESIHLSEDNDGGLIAEHRLKLWALDVYIMTYRITKKPAGVAN